MVQERGGAWRSHCAIEGQTVRKRQNLAIPCRSARSHCHREAHTASATSYVTWIDLANEVSDTGWATVRLNERRDPSECAKRVNRRGITSTSGRATRAFVEGHSSGRARVSVGLFRSWTVVSSFWRACEM
jgi:hypothetical protein